MRGGIRACVETRKSLPSRTGCITSGYGLRSLPRMSPQVRTPEIVELRSFCAAADLGSLGRAAVRMHVSQPALSKRLQSLEAVAGVRLLDRSSRGVTLTTPGRRLYEQARRLLEQADAIEAVIENLQRDRGPV